MLIDSHCHIPMLEDISFDAVLSNAREHDVTHMLCVSVDLESCPDVIATAEKDEHIYATVGVHPNTETESEVTEQELLSLAEHPR